MDLHTRRYIRSRHSELPLASAVCTLSLAAALSFFVVACGGPIQRNNLVGSWQIDTSLPRSFVFTFHNDHSCEQALTGADVPLVGTWTLDRDQLVIVLHSMSNELGNFNIFGTTPVRVTNRIVKLNDSVMIWRDVGKWRGTKLKRLKTPASRTDSNCQEDDVVSYAWSCTQHQ